MMICQVACASVLRGATPTMVPSALTSKSETASTAAFSVCVHGAQLAPHFPADPEQQQSAGEQQADDLKQLRGDAGEADAHQRGRADADQDGLGALLFRQAGGRQPDDDRIVAGKHEVDEDDFEECRQCVSGEEFQHGGMRLLRCDARRARAEPCRSKRASGTAEPCDVVRPTRNQRAKRVVVKIPRGATPTGSPVRHRSPRGLPEGPGLEVLDSPIVIADHPAAVFVSIAP